MLRKFEISALLMSLALPVLADGNGGQENLKLQLEQIKTYSAQFVQVVKDGEGELLQESSGRINMAQPNKMRWQPEDEDGSVMIADGQSLWLIDPLVEQVVVMSQDQAVANNPMILLTQPDSANWQNFNVSQQGDVYTITSKSGDSNIQALELTFDGDTLKGLLLQDRQQQSSELKFADIKQNQPVAEIQFQFTLPEGYDLDDQR